MKPKTGSRRCILLVAFLLPVHTFAMEEQEYVQERINAHSTKVPASRENGPDAAGLNAWLTIRALRKGIDDLGLDEPDLQIVKNELISVDWSAMSDAVLDSIHADLCQLLDTGAEVDVLTDRFMDRQQAEGQMFQARLSTVLPKLSPKAKSAILRIGDDYARSKTVVKVDWPALGQEIPEYVRFFIGNVCSRWRNPELIEPELERLRAQLPSTHSGGSFSLKQGGEEQ